MDSLSEDARLRWERVADSYRAHCLRDDSWNVLVEIPAMMDMLGDVRDKRIVDVGCGQGHYAISLAQMGAKLTALEQSPTLFSYARKNAACSGVQVDWLCAGTEGLAQLPDAQFDIALFAMMLEYVDDLPGTFREAHRILSPEGFIAVSIVHPVRMGETRIEHPDGDKLVVVDHYLACRTTTGPGWLTDAEGDPVPITGYHRTVEEYVAAFRNAGFLIEQIREPAPVPAAETKAPPVWTSGRRCPQFMLFKAVKDPRSKL